MADRSKIEWTDATWNPIRGCSRVSEGCRNCYAERQAARFAGAGQAYEGLATGLNVLSGPRWTGEIRFIPELLNQPVRWRRPRRIFVNSMSDLFHENVHGDWIDRIFAAMQSCPQHTFQILTKRAQRMRALMRHYLPLPNVWLGVSVEDQKTADERIPLLLQTPAVVRWVSYEPALGPVNFQKFYSRMMGVDEIPGWALNEGCTEGKTLGLDWLVAGGESGPGARPTHPDWFRQVRDQCYLAKVPFFFKQWGEWVPAPSSGLPFHKTYKGVVKDGAIMLRVGKKRAGGLLDGIPWREFPKTSGTLP